MPALPGESGHEMKAFALNRQFNHDPGGAPVVIRLRRVSKRFGEIWANRDISLTIHQGEIHALVGENGAGKSTLMGLLYGHSRPDAGAIEVGGVAVRLASPRAAIALGIGLVHQDLLIFPQLSALRNILIGHEPSRWGWISETIARRRITSLCSEFNFAIDLDCPAADLPYAQRQQIELLRLLVRDASVLILDEPTSLLAAPEIERLFELLRRLRRGGRTVIFVSHRLNEVFALADRISVLRRGRLAGTWERSATTPAAVARAIMGEDEPSALDAAIGNGQQAPPQALAGGDLAAGNTAGMSRKAVPLLELTMVSTASLGQETGLERVSFQVAAGEIIGFGGIVGNGLRNLARALSGFLPLTSGRIVYAGEDITGASPASRIRAGLRRLPANPDEEAALPGRPIWENVVLGHHRRRDLGRAGIMRRTRVRTWVEQRLAELDVVYGRVDDPLQALSGGNRQKLALARTLAGEVRLVVLEQPTRGLDFRARAACHQQLRRMSGGGVAVLLCSHDLDELFALSGRLGIFFRGRLVGLESVPALDRQTAARWLLGAGDAAGAGQCC